jgi:hypothetical protein
VRILYAYIVICAISAGLAVWAAYRVVSTSEPIARSATGLHHSDSDTPFKGARRICAPGAICP